MNITEVEQYLKGGELDGYTTGMDRSVTHTDNLVAHVYKGPYDNLTHGMCKRSMKKDGSFSIFRNNVGRKGICKLCLRATYKQINYQS